MSKKTVWTRFMDVHSGGGLKEDFQYCLIEAPEEEAKIIFYNRFGHNPERVSCTCCGEDYSISESKSLEEATAYDRGCKWVKNKYVEEPDPETSYKEYQTVAQYLKNDDVKVIYAQDIKPEERVGEVPQEGYVWV